MTKQTRKKLIAFIFALVAVVGIGVTYVVWPARLPPIDASTVELVKFVATDKFADLSDDAKQKYVQSLMDKGLPALLLAANEAKLTEAQCQRGIDNATQAAINIRMGAHLDAWL